MALTDWPDGDAYAHLWARVPPNWSGISVDAGWAEIVLDADAALAQLDPGYEIYQVKEKIGWLRYYCSIDYSSAAKKIIAEAERRAARTCEICGDKGGHVTNEPIDPTIWYRTLCPRCRRMESASMQRRRGDDGEERDE